MESLQLTESQERITRLKCLGYSQKQIADKLYNSIHTIKTHVRNAMATNGLKNGFELVARYAVEHPHIFRNAVAMVLISIQSFSIANDYRIDYKRPSKTRIIKRMSKRLKNN